MAFQQLQTPADTRQIPAVVCWPGPPSTPFRTPGVFYAGSDGRFVCRHGRPRGKGISHEMLRHITLNRANEKFPKKYKLLLLLRKCYARASNDQDLLKNEIHFLCPCEKRQFALEKSQK
jgi:hypothetical protein